MFSCNNKCKGEYAEITSPFFCNKKKKCKWSGILSSPTYYETENWNFLEKENLIFYESCLKSKPTSRIKKTVQMTASIRFVACMLRPLDVTAQRGEAEPMGKSTIRSSRRSRNSFCRLYLPRDGFQSLSSSFFPLTLFHQSYSNALLFTKHQLMATFDDFFFG